MNFDFIKIGPNNPLKEVFYKNGFLSGLDGEIKKKVNESFIKLYNFLITTNKYNQLNYICFPIIRRVVSETNIELQDPESFCDYCLEWVLCNEDHINKMIEHGIKIDKEAQICYELSETIIKIIKET